MPSILRAVFGSGRIRSDPGPWGAGMVRMGGGGSSDSVTTDSSMRLSAVFACIRLLSEAVATMPLDTFERNGDERLPYPRPEYLEFRPPQGSRIDYLSQVMLSLLTDGNAFVATPRNDLGEPLTLVVMDPGAVQVERSSDGRLSYTVAGQTGFSELDVMHIKAMTLPDRLRGLSPLGYARETIDLGLAAQRFGATFFNNGALPSVVIEAPGEVPQKNAERMATIWDSRHRGVANASRVGVLTGGAKLTKVSIVPEEAQFLETRQFQVPDIARFFGVPPHLIADASNSTSWGSGLAEQNLAFGQFSLRPWVDRIEDAHGRLLTTQGLSRVFVKLNMDALLRAGTKERYDAYAVGLDNGFLKDNEVRRLEDLPPLPELPEAEPEVAAALELAAKAPSLVQEPGLPALVDQLRVLNGKRPLNPVSPPQESTL